MDSLCIDARRPVENCKPDIMARHHDQHHLDKYRSLLCYRAFIGAQAAEGKSDKHRKNRYYDLRYNVQYDLLEFIQNQGYRLRLWSTPRQVPA